MLPTRTRTASTAFTLVLLLLAGPAGLSGCGETARSPIRAPAETLDRIPLPDMGPAEPFPVRVERSIPLVRHEGETSRRLYADLYLPEGAGPAPTLLQATAYRREIMEFAGFPPSSLASDGYAVVLVDVMGTGSSEGGWESFSDREIQDLVWIIDHWIPAQAWSNGKVGMFGSSYQGMAALLTAGRRPEHLKAIFPGMTFADAYRDIYFHGGIFDQEFISYWAAGTMLLSLLPGTQSLVDPESADRAYRDHLEQIPEVLSWVLNTTDSPFFDERSAMTYWERIAGLPMFTTAGWWDLFTRGSLLNYAGLVREARRQAGPAGRPAPKRLVIGPWYHLNAGAMRGLPADVIHKRWFDWHLKADEDPDYARYDILDPRYPILLYVLGAERWRKERAWPLARARYERLLLSGEVQSNDRNPSLNNGSLVWESATPDHAPAPALPASTPIGYDPAQDVSRFSGVHSRSSCRWLLGLTSFEAYTEDERENERNVLTFSTAPLDRDLEVTGPAVLRLWARTHFSPPLEDPPDLWFAWTAGMGLDISPLIPWASRPDVHWAVHLNDVFPDGRVRNLTSGWLAASHRPDPARPDWTQPGYDPGLYPEDARPDAPEDGVAYEYVIEIWPTCNAFQAGHQIRIDIATSDFPHLLPTLVPSASEILHDAAHPSRLILPVVDPAETDPGQWVDDPVAYLEGRVPWSSP